MLVFSANIVKTKSNQRQKIKWSHFDAARYLLSSSFPETCRRELSNALLDDYPDSPAEMLLGRVIEIVENDICLTTRKPPCAGTPDSTALHLVMKLTHVAWFATSLPRKLRT